MMEFIKNSAFFGAMISLIAYEIGLILKKKFKMAIFNPLLISIICVIGVLLIFHIDYDDYNEGGKYISYLLTPATVCLAVPLYEQIHLLKKNLKAVAAGIFSGTLAGLCSILLMAKLFGFDHQEYVTMLPKSITTAIGMGVSEELGGIVTITVAVIIITGVLGNMLAEVVYKIAKIEEPIARGLGLGTSAHAIGTAKAMELGPVEGAMSSLAIAVAGLLTVVGASVKRSWTWNICPCYRNSQSHGAWPGRRSHEQPCHCSCRIAYGCRRIGVRGLGLGTSAHAIGTAKAMELGPVEGAMSSLAIAVAGLLTVVGASVFAGMM